MIKLFGWVISSDNQAIESGLTHDASHWCHVGALSALRVVTVWDKRGKMLVVGEYPGEKQLPKMNVCAYGQN